jgi:hypothetical protein
MPETQMKLTCTILTAILDLCFNPVVFWVGAGDADQQDE